MKTFKVTYNNGFEIFKAANIYELAALLKKKERLTFNTPLGIVEVEGDSKMNMPFKIRRKLERQIAIRVVKDALAEGWLVTVDNGADEDVTLVRSDSLRAVLAAMFATDDETLSFSQDGVRKGWVRFVYGNSGWDVVNDYSTGIEALMEGANGLADELETKYDS